MLEPYATNCWNLDTAVVDVAKNESATIPPATASDMYGDEVPIPTFPV